MTLKFCEQQRVILFASCAVLCALATGISGFDSTPYCTIHQKCYPSRKELRTLGESINGRVIFRNQKEYRVQSETHNINEQRSPYVIVIVKTEDDIRTTVLFARKYNLHVVIHSSGHSYVGRSTADDAFVINMSEMDEYKIKLKDRRHGDGVLITQTGVTWGELYEALDKVDRVAVGGACPTVTPGGYTLGGGHGAVSQTHGYAVDNLLEARVVLADGRFATCTEKKTTIENLDGKKRVINNGDLFWALKGGGGGTYGVVVPLVFKIHQAPESVVAFRAILPLQSDALPGGDILDEVFDAFFTSFNALSSEWGGYWITDNLPSILSGNVSAAPYPYVGSLRIYFLKLAPWDGTETALFSETLNISATYNMTAYLINMTSFLEFEQVLAAFMPEREDVYLFSTLLQPWAAGAPLATWYSQTLFAPGQAFILCSGIKLGGATMTSSTDTPLHPGYRSAVTALLCAVLLQDPYDDQLIYLGDQLGQSLKTFGEGEYFNEPTKNNPSWKEDFWGMENYQRLLHIKNLYDPTNFFTCHHCVGSDDTPYDGPLSP